MLSRGAQRLLTDIQDLTRRYERGAFKSQATYADDWGYDVRTIKRWSRELREAGLLTFTQGRGHQKARWNPVENPVENSTRGTKNVPLNVPLRTENVPLAEPHIGVSSTEYGEKQPARKPQAVENSYHPGQMPPMTITSPSGRVEPNPEFYRIQAILRARLPAIKAARNPEAYIQAIIRAEKLA